VELVAFLKVLWRFRIAVVVGAVVAIAAGLWVAKGATSRIGVASMRVILDTPQSLTVDVNPPGMDTLFDWRSHLLADLMSTSTSREQIAGEMGIPIDSLVVTAPYLSQPAASFPLPLAGLDAAAVAPEPYGLAIQSVDLPPIIEIDSRAPDRQRAAQLAGAAANALKAAAAVKAVPGKTQEFVVNSAGPPQAWEVVDGPGRLKPALAGAFVFGLWCAGIAFAAAFARVRRGRPGAPAPSSGFGWS
jgi:hypothetical protein